jgi:hypothetical protein
MPVDPNLLHWNKENNTTHGSSEKFSIKSTPNSTVNRRKQSNNTAIPGYKTPSKNPRIHTFFDFARRAPFKHGGPGHQTATGSGAIFSLKRFNSKGIRRTETEIFDEMRLIKITNLL